MSSAKSQKAVARLGGHARAASLSPERRREIALAASVEAAKRRHGQVTIRELTAFYISQCKAEDYELGRFVELALKAAWAADRLPDEYRAVAGQAVAEVAQRLGETQRA